MTRVVHISSGHETHGGAEKSLIELVMSEQNAGLTPHVIVPKQGPLFEKFTQMGIETKIIRSYQWVTNAGDPGWLRSLIGTIKILANLVVEPLVLVYIIRHRIDVVHINSSATAVGALSALLLRKNLVWHIREFNSFESGRVLPFSKIQKELINKSEVVVATSRAVLCNYLDILSKDKTRVIYDPVTLDQKKDVSPKFDSHIITLLSVGIISPAKGQLDLVNAIKQLPFHLQSHISLVFVGKPVDSKYRSEIVSSLDKCRLAKPAEFYDHIDDPSEKFQSADIVVVTSKCESYGRVTVEAMSAGCLVIGADNTATEELLSNDRGLIYGNNPVELSATLFRVLSDPKEYTPQRENGRLFAREIVEKNYDNTLFLRILNRIPSKVR